MMTHPVCKLYDAILKRTGEVIFQFKFFPGMAYVKETTAQAYMDRRYHGNVIVRPHVEEVAAS